MILTRIDIENFKQYRGEHSIEVPGQGAIGVIGENGTGKTTLFEALEWCLYSPRSLAAADVRSREGSGPTSVTVYLESFDGERQFIVERILKRTPSATIYRVNPDGDIEPLVQGTRQVSDYVSTKLIGLSHTAFTATFFTRQKELHLFDDQTPGKRREEVGRLLGLETIRTAQRKIVHDRSRATATARTLQAQVDQETDNRDLMQEIAAADQTIAVHRAERQTANEALAEAIGTHAKADATLKRVQERRDRDTALGHDLTTARQHLANLDQAMQQAHAELARFDRRAEERKPLVAIASKLPELKRQVAAQEEQRTLFQQRASLERDIHEDSKRHRDALASVADIVVGVQIHSRLDGWIWTPDDNAKALSGLDRLIEIASSADAETAELTERTLHNVVSSHQRLETERQKLLQYRQRRADLDQRQAEFLNEGEPTDAIARIDFERERLLKERTTVDATRTSSEAEQGRARQILGNLQSQQIGGDCPTCGRPFSRQDAEVVIATLRARAEQLSQEIASFVAQAAAINRQIGAIETQRKQIQARGKALAEIRTSIERSAAFLENQQDAVNAATVALDKAFATSALKAVPTENDLADANSATVQARNLRGSISALKSASASLAAIEAHLERAHAERNALGDVSFDAAGFSEIREALAKANRAEASIHVIGRELARRPTVEQEIGNLKAQHAESSTHLAQAEASRKTLAYSPTELENAQSALKAALEHERSATEHAHQMETALHNAEHRRDAIVREQARLEQLTAQANASEVEAETLNLMAREFTEFERFAAARKLPILAELTSQLVESITDGRYNRVEFDQDFGIAVFDGESSDASYPVSTFSGGERDAIILAARVALSHMIGRQATSPPGFLVLDEVFGSLDANRRLHLIDALGAITRSFDELRQVFIISHVDDVRTSPVLDELWRIEESPEGGSTVTSLPAGAEIDAL